jgi:heptose I phosphotransferase
VILELPEDWRRRWAGSDPFEAVMSLEGDVFKSRQGRSTFRFELDGRPYFAKLHRGIGWRILLRYLAQLRWPVVSARSEWRALQRLPQIGVPTMKLVAYGERGWNPARRQSFIVTEALEPTVNLEDHCRPWRGRPPAPSHKRALIAEVARIARQIHEHGLNHRDFYLCHLLLQLAADGAPPPGPPTLYLIDLHRVQQRRRLPWRWRMKDIAGLYFSSRPAGLTRTDRVRFMTAYTGRPLRETLRCDGAFWRRVARKAEAFQREFDRKHPHLTDACRPSD